MSPERPFQLTFLPFDGFSNMVLASAVEPLRAACDISGNALFRWQVATLGGQSVRSSSGMQLRADTALEEIERADALVIVAGYGVREQAEPPQVRAAMRTAARRADSLMGLDMGAWIMAASGLLRGRRATVHWYELDAFSEAFLDVDVVADSYVVDRDRQSAGSATSAMSLILELIRDRAGDALAHDVSTLFIYDTAEARRAESGTLSPRLGRAVRWMLKFIEDPLPLSEISAQAGVSLRSLDRMFHRELGVSAGQYYRRLRLTQARSLAMETSMPTHEIAARTGFGSAATLARAFKVQFGGTISELRRGTRV
jgi:transcriptional regulator GlxA family with amidase domain